MSNVISFLAERSAKPAQRTDLFGYALPTSKGFRGLVVSLDGEVLWESQALYATKDLALAEAQPQIVPASFKAVSHAA